MGFGAFRARFRSNSGPPKNAKSQGRLAPCEFCGNARFAPQACPRVVSETAMFLPTSRFASEIWPHGLPHAPRATLNGPQPRGLLPNPRGPAAPQDARQPRICRPELAFLGGPEWFPSLEPVAPQIAANLAFKMAPPTPQTAQTKQDFPSPRLHAIGVRRARSPR